MPFRPLHLLLAAAFVLAGCGSAAPAALHRVETSPSATSPTTKPPPPPPPPVPITYPARGHHVFAEAPAQNGGPDGHAGQLKTYRVLVEKDIKGLAPAAFADAVRATLADPRGWTAGGQWRFRRVGPGQAYNFTLYLATPDTKDELCAGSPDGYTSCRNKGAVVLNVARWVKGIPRYGAPLATYRQYMVNHEVGHALGHGHELCPGPGRPAPVMQQQTLGLHGCTANAWPFINGKSYAGRSGQYDDPVPPRDTGVPSLTSN